MLWEDKLSCGHDRLVEISVNLDRSVRVDEPTVCYQCEPPDRVVTVTATRCINANA